MPAPVTFTAEQDHQNMMTQLGIQSLRPGPSGDPKAPDHANYDESKANPWPALPDALVLNNGQKVTNAQMWWKERRPQIVHDYEQYVYGFVPKDVPKVRWSVIASEKEMVGFHPVIATELKGEVDNSSYPLVSVSLRMTVVTPADAKGPVPLLMMFGPSGFPAPVQPSVEELSRINAALKAMLEKQDPSLKAVITQHPGWEPVRPVPFEFPKMNADGDPPSTWELSAAGWGFAMLDPQSAQADNAAGLTRGIIGLVNKGQPRKPDQWGALRAWAWAASRGLDYLETDPAVDSKHVGIEGVSRYGKAALVTMAFDQRFAMVLVGSSGKGGATPLRRNLGEAVESLTGGEYYWMAGNFMKYGASKATFGSMTPGDIPVDSNELIALCAPRLTFISYGIPEKGDAQWLDQRGSWMATVAASPVWTLLGAPGLSTDDLDYQKAKMPPVNDGLLGGKLAWRQDDGGHTDAPNVKYFSGWADKFIGYPAKN
ncbi:MAG: acetylxylan esterase [Acidobacteria bacterium]|nr:acetylxylan esterase [Acidobacteriota bacterium]MBW4046222.1 acetylxylan esterase [Acidobacteriota bacterium]